MQTKPSTPGRDAAARWAWIVLACGLLFAIVVRVHRLGLPLERDEGEYAYGARLILDGDFSYETLRTLKLPGVHLALAPFLAVFGDRPATVHLALLVIDLASALVTFFLVRRFLGPRTAALSAVLLACTQLSSTLLGLFAHAENFALLCLLVGLWLATHAQAGKGVLAWAASGLAFGLAFLMKQPALAFAAVVLGSGLVVQRAQGGRAILSRLGVFLASCAVPFGLVCAWMAAIGGFEAFWFSTVTYARAYGSGVTWELGSRELWKELASVGRLQPVLSALALVGLVAFAVRRELRARAPLLAALAVAGAAATAAGLYFRAHYFVMLLPAVVILAACGAESIAAWCLRAGPWRSRAAAGLVALAVLSGSWLERDVQWTDEPETVSRTLYWPNPFAESDRIAKLVRDHSRPGDRVAVLGSEPQIPFLAGRRSATGFVYMYPLLEEQPYAAQMQDQAIREIESVQPRVVVCVNVRISWLRRTRSETRILDWYPKFLQGRYRPVGMVELVSPLESRWLDSAQTSEARDFQGSSVVVFERVPGT